jgi:hypothetical protein
MMLVRGKKSKSIAGEISGFKLLKKYEKLKNFILCGPTSNFLLHFLLQLLKSNKKVHSLLSNQPLERDFPQKKIKIY